MESCEPSGSGIERVFGFGFAACCEEWLCLSVVKRQLILGYALHPEMREAKQGLRDLSGVAELERTFLPEGHSHIRTTGGAAGFYGTLFLIAALARYAIGVISQIVTYSDLSATIGSTRVARRAGIKQATTDTIISTNDTPTNVSGSVGDTPYSKPRSSLESNNAPTSPIPSPINAIVIPCRTTKDKTFVRRAPNAMRIPISCVRQLTA